MNVQTSDYLLARSSMWLQPIWRWMGNRETAWMRAELSSIKIEKPVFITGLARAGTTILLETLASSDGFACHRYRDFPFLTVPCFWNQIVGKSPAAATPTERAHRDRIEITRESPEAFEEPLWQSFFPEAHSSTALHRLDRSQENPCFEQFFRDHMRKIIWIRSRQRYLSKGNYNVTRIEYLAKLFPDASFIVVVREPLTHIHSLVCQHHRFTEYAQQDPRVPHYLAAAGHYEFGPQRVPIRLDHLQTDRILEAWSQNDQYLGYAIQWAEIYRFVNQLRNASDVASQIHIVRYEDFCDDPETTIRDVLRHIDVDPESATQLFAGLSRVAKSSHHPAIDASLRCMLIDTVQEVAQEYGYDANPV